MSYFNSIKALPEDPIFGIQAAFNNDPNSKKVNLGIGAYRDALGKPLVFTAVRKAEALLLEQHLNKEYLPIAGSKDYLHETAKLLFGDKQIKLTDGSLFGVQTVGGTAALRIGGEFLDKSKKIYLPNLTWTNHKLVFARAGLKTDSYSYYDELNAKFDFEAMCESLKKIPEGSILVLHGTSHNPTGLNPTLDQWKILSKLLKELSLFPFFDISYQGFGTGVVEDMEPLRYFVEQGHELLVAYTYAKTMGLYGERVGALFAVTENKNIAQKVGSHLSQIIRSMYSNPPLHGARIVTTVLQSESLKAEWIEELNNMRGRINEMKTAFITGLMAKESDTRFQFLSQQKHSGLFLYLGLNPDQVHRLRQEFSIYLPDGRISLAGVNTGNIDYILEAIVSV